MKVLWGIALCLCFSLLVNAEADPKKYNKEIHAGKPQKKTVALQYEDEEPKEKKVPVPSLTTVPSEGKSAFNPVPENKGVIGIPGIGLVGLGLPVLGGGAGLGGLAPILTGLFAIGAALAAGFAALVGIIVPPLQIANQILAIIAIALLIAYVVEDKKYGYEDYESGYGDYDLGYSSSGGYDMGYAEPSSSYGAPAGDSGTSSYSSYRRSGAAEEGQRRPRSNANRPLVNRVSGMVSDAVKKYSEMYSD